MSVGIYQILNTVTGKCYVGSSKNTLRRWKTHKKLLFGQSHHSPKLQRSWNKYGRDVWEWNILQECLEAQLDCLEVFWQAKLDSYHNGYDSTLLMFNGLRVVRTQSLEVINKRANSNRGKKRTLETKTKLSNAAKNISNETRKKRSLALRNPPEETRIKLRSYQRNRPKEHQDKLSDSNRGRKASLETREKQSVAQKGRAKSEEFKNKLRGRKVSLETREKQSVAQQTRSEELREKMGSAMRGKKHKPETILKMKEAKLKKLQKCEISNE